jgi:hypothetical protein
LNTNRILYFLICVTPFIDLLNGLVFFVLKIDLPLSPGQVIRSFLFVIMLYLILKRNPKYFLFIISFVALFCLCILMQQFWVFNVGLQDFVIAFKYIFTFASIYFFLAYADTLDREKVIKSLILASTSIATIVVVLGLSGVGLATYGTGEGQKGLFKANNDITAVLSMIIPFIVYRLSINYSSAKLVILFMNVLGIVFVGSKTGMGMAVIMVGIYCLVVLFKQNTISRIKIIGLCSVVVFAVYSFCRDAICSAVTNIVTRQTYFFNNLDLPTYLLSGRNIGAMASLKALSNSNIIVNFFGVGYINGLNVLLPNFGGITIEMDYFELYYFYGIIIATIYAAVIIRFLYKVTKQMFRMRNIYTFMLGISFYGSTLISFFGGHVLSSAIAGTIYGVIISLVEKNSLERSGRG